MKALFALLVVYQLKHFLCDYILQSHPVFLGKFRADWSFVEALSLHCAIHAAFTFGIALYWSGAGDLALLLAGFDFLAHFTMDRLKASPHLMGRWKALSATEMEHILSFKKTTGINRFKPALRGNLLFWNALGLDQLVHHLTHYLIIWCLWRS